MREIISVKADEENDEMTILINGSGGEIVASIIAVIHQACEGNNLSDLDMVRFIGAYLEDNPVDIYAIRREEYTQ